MWRYHIGMGKLKKTDVEHIGKLANLKLTSEEIEKFQGQLTKILDYVEELNEVDTSNTKPTSQTTGLTDVIKEDKLDLSQGLKQEETLSGTEKTYNDYFVVPYVLTQKDDH